MSGVDIEEWYCRIPPNARKDKRLSPLALRVLMALGEHLDKDAQCWARQERLGNLCDVSRQRAQQAIRELEDFGYVVILGRRHRACLYQVLDADPSKPRTKRKRNKGRSATPGVAPNNPQNATPGVALPDQKNLPPGLHDLATPGVAQTYQGTCYPSLPPFGREDADGPSGPNQVLGGGSPNGDHAEAASRPGDATKNQKGLPRREHVSKSERPSTTKGAPTGLSGALVAKAANALRSPASKPATRQDAFQRAICDKNGTADERHRLTVIALEEGEEAALAACGFDRYGNRTKSAGMNGAQARGG